MKGTIPIVSIAGLKEHPRNQYFFDDIDGESWKDFLKSIETSGVIEPIVITDNNTIISGHQRVRACKELNIPAVKATIVHYDNEDKILKDLIETNIRQRGIGNPNPVKFGRCIIELERIYGIRNGSANEKGNNRIGDRNNFCDQMTQEDLAGQLGITTKSLQNYKRLASLIPEVEEFLDTGMITATTALGISRQLSQDDQLTLISQLDKETKYSAKEIQPYIDEIKLLKKKAEKKDIEKDKSNPPENPSNINNNLLTKQLDEKNSKILSQEKRIKELEEENSKMSLELSDVLHKYKPCYSGLIDNDKIYEFIKECKAFLQRCIEMECSDYIQAVNSTEYITESFDNICDSIIHVMMKLQKHTDHDVIENDSEYTKDNVDNAIICIG